MALFSVSLHLPPPGLKLQVLLLNSGPAAHHLKVNIRETSVGRKESLLYFGYRQPGVGGGQTSAQRPTPLLPTTSGHQLLQAEGGG